MALTHPAKSPGTWRYEDLIALPDDGRRWEIIDGELYELPPPTTDHGSAIMNLIALLLPTIAALGGRFFTAPVGVFFGGANPVEPDLLVLLPAHSARIEKRGIEGAPDLVIEVLSPSNRPHDSLRKRALYARAGIPEYWLVDTEATTIEVLPLDGADYRRHLLASGEAMVTSRVLPDLAFPAAVVFAAALPR